MPSVAPALPSSRGVLRSTYDVGVGLEPHVAALAGQLSGQREAHVLPKEGFRTLAGAITL